MRYVLDASVAVAALRRTEQGHAAALSRCMPLFAGIDEMVVPAIFDIEVTAALVRRGASAVKVAEVLKRHFSSRLQITIGPRAAVAVCNVLGLTKLRAADAIYVWVSASKGLPLVTLDQEVIQRAHLVGAIAVPP